MKKVYVHGVRNLVIVTSSLTTTWLLRVYNLPVQKRERRDFIMTKMENGDLKGRIAVLEVKLKDATYLLEQVVQDLNEKDLM